jgi:hypothetical protein
LSTRRVAALDLRFTWCDSASTTVPKSNVVGSLLSDADMTRLAHRVISL